LAPGLNGLFTRVINHWVTVIGIVAARRRRLGSGESGESVAADS